MVLEDPNNRSQRDSIVSRERLKTDLGREFLKASLVRLSVGAWQIRQSHRHKEEDTNHGILPQKGTHQTNECRRYLIKRNPLYSNQVNDS